MILLLLLTVLFFASTGLMLLVWAAYRRVIHGEKGALHAPR